MMAMMMREKKLEFERTFPLLDHDDEDDDYKPLHYTLQRIFCWGTATAAADGSSQCNRVQLAT